MKKIIPGHAIAFTIWLFVTLAVVAYFETRSWEVVFGLFLLMLGAFLGDQATHLAQNDHSGISPTWIEREMQKYRWTWTVVGVLMAIFGFIIIL